ncbi:MAG: ECF-type sigma factor [Bryobacteraceae bacterium]
MDHGPVTRLLQDFARGDKGALDRLMPLVYDELKRLASGYLRGERSGHTLQPTALVHEAYARLVQQERHAYQNRTHFLAAASARLTLAEVLLRKGDRQQAVAEATGAAGIWRSLLEVEANQPWQDGLAKAEALIGGSSER